MTDLIRVSATGRAAGYMPEFVARELGYFAARDIEVETVVPHDWEQVLTDLGSGAADLALGGIWVPSMYRGRGKEFWVTAQLCNRGAFSLVGREPLGEPIWEALRGSTVLIPGRGGASLGLFFQLLLAEHGVDASTVTTVKDLTGAMMTELFRGGAGDFLMTAEVGALALIDDGFTEVFSALSEGDDIPWSVYYTNPETLGARGDALARFNAALDEAMEFMNATPAAEFAPRVAKWYPGVPVERLVEAVEQMQEAGMWTSTTLRPASYARWQGGIAAGGLVAAPLDRETIAAPLALGA